MTLIELIKTMPGEATATDAEVLAWLQGGSGTFEPTLLNARGLMARYGAQKAADFLDKLEAAAASSNVLKWANKFLTTEGIDVGNAETRTQLDQLKAAGVITGPEAAAMKGFARELTRWELNSPLTLNERVLRLGPGLAHVAEARA